MEAPKRKRKNRGGSPEQGQASWPPGNHHLPYVPVPIGGESSANARKRHSSFSQQRLPLAPLTIPPPSSFYNAPSSAISSTFDPSPEPSPAFSYHSSPPNSNLASSNSDLGHPPLFNLNSSTQSMPPPRRRRRTSSIPYRRDSQTSLLDSPLRQSFTSDGSNSSFVAQRRSAFAPTHAAVLDHNTPFSNALQRYDTAPQLTTHAPSFDYQHPQQPSSSSIPSSTEIYGHQKSNLRRVSMTNAVRPHLAPRSQVSSTQVASSENSGVTLDSLKEMENEIIEKYMKMDEKWGREVRRDLTRLLRGLEKGDHTISGGTDIRHYFDRLTRETRVVNLPTPLELPTTLQEAQYCNSKNTLTIERTSAPSNFSNRY